MTPAMTAPRLPHLDDDAATTALAATALATSAFDAAPATPAHDAAAGRPRADHLFRASARHGRLHPLYLPLLKYRQAGATA